MMRTCTILVTDRNKYIRELVKRELSFAGYTIHVAENIHEIQSILNSTMEIDAMILDADLFFVVGDPNELLNMLKIRPKMWTFIHIYKEHPELQFDNEKTFCIEKKAGSIEEINLLVKKMCSERE